jgi:hypothetical protein
LQLRFTFFLQPATDNPQPAVSPDLRRKRIRGIMKDGQETARVHMLVQSSLLAAFHPLLQTGVDVETPTGITVKRFLCGELGLAPDYPDTFIQTVFLNGKAVDDLDSALIADGSTLALSAAMPGLLGATLRRGSFFAAMRKEISHQGHSPGAASRMGRIRVKIFNLLLDDLGRILLGKGVWGRGKEVQDLFGTVHEPFWAGCREALLDDRSIDPATLHVMEWGDQEVFLRVTPAD